MREDRKEKSERKQRQDDILNQQLLDDLYQVFSKPEGKRALLWIFKAAFMFETTFTGNSSTFKNEGRRDLALILMYKIMEREPSIIADVFNMAQQLKLARANIN